MRIIIIRNKIEIKITVFDKITLHNSQAINKEIRELLKTDLKDVPLWAQYIGKNRFL